MDVLLVAVKKEIVNSYADAIEEAGLMPTVMDVDYFALENMYEANYAGEGENGVVGFIHIGAQIHQHYAIAKWHFHVHRRSFDSAELISPTPCQATGRRRRGRRNIQN